MRLATVMLAMLLSGLAWGVDQRRVGNILLEDVPPVQAGALDAVAPYLETRAARLMGWLPSGAAVIRTRFSNTDQLHLVTHPLAARHQLTFYPEPIRQAVVSPSPVRAELVFLKDRSGDENHGIYLLDLKSRAVEELTQPGTRNGAPVWSPDGNQLAFYSNARDGRHWDIYVTKRQHGGPPTAILETDQGAWLPLDFSPDGKRLLLEQYFSINDSRLWILDLASRDLKSVVLPSAGVNQAAFAKDGSALWVSTDAFSEFRELIRLDPASGHWDSFTAHIKWDVELFVQSDDAHWLAYSSNENGFSRLGIVNLRDNLELNPPDLPGARIDQMSFQPGASALGLTLSSPTAPANLFRLEPGGTGFEQWTASEVGGLDQTSFVEASNIHFETFDQVDGQPRVLQALYYQPKAGGPHPVLIDIHGGPEGQAKPSFQATLQLFAKQLGFAILRPNVRGSAGFGRSFLKLDNGRLREGSVRDIGALLDWIEKQPQLDHTRVAVIGGSYGGYMVLASLAAYGERLMGGIDRVGISNFVTFLEHTSDYRRDLRRAEYGDERDVEMRTFLEDISPTRHAAKLARPLLIVQGRNDPRVPLAESQQMVAEIRGAGGQVWYLEAMDEGHGLRKKANQRLYLAVAMNFLRALLGAERQSQGNANGEDPS